ncbi:MAG TPA: YidC/Oxa1 family membrane protein insertase [Ktedonobacteraceae bacterium]|nr:YidC/Oxa1 family membrane protein insertase [Ktedonobacteraceae bacterium]
MGAILDLFNLVFTYPIFNGLVVLYHLFGDFALSIVVLTVIIKLILFPLTLQQLRSTKAMQALQPQIAEIRKKYGKDQQGVAQATQQLYKEYGVNPVAGCLPLLIQLPVLYGLFYALDGIVRQNNLQVINSHIYSFIPKFAHMPDLTFSWFSWLSFLHPILPGVPWSFPLNLPDPTHILPILAGLATFISLRMSQPKPVQLTQTKSSSASGNVADVSAQTMKTMQYIMPLFTVFIGWNFPSGLALYWTVSSIFQAIQQYFVTGWGSLLTTPNIQPKAASQAKVVESTISERSSNNKRQQERERSSEEAESDEEEGESDSNGPIAQNMRPTTPRSGGTSTYTRRRKSSNSASARRRSAQKSRS